MAQLTYSLVGEYYLPNIILSDSPDAPPLGRYGMLHKEYLREHRPILFSKLAMSEKLFPVCRSVDEAARTRLETIADREQSHEIILHELVYI
jgi:hypothetical protein